MKAKIFLIMLFVGLMTMGFECVNDFLLAINIQGVSGTYKINPGGNINPSDCKTILSSDYLDSGYGTFGNVRIYDIKVSTIGSYNATITGGQITVNGVPILGYSGSWASFNTPQSFVTSPLLTRNAAGIAALVDAIKNKQSITICGSGTVTPGPVPDGLFVKVEVFGQVDAKP